MTASDPKTGSEAVLHATTVAYNNRALLIMGASGSGKSGLALMLLAHGCTLVADDRTQLHVQNDAVIANAPPTIAGLIEARGIGILKTPAAGPTPLALVVDLDRVETKRLPPHRTITLLGVDFPLVHKVESDHFQASLLLYLKSARSDAP